jgi:hypothetical protein
MLVAMCTWAEGQPLRERESVCAWNEGEEKRKTYSGVSEIKLEEQNTTIWKIILILDGE